MIHDKKLQLADLVAWLETQAPEKGYDYTDDRGCLLFQYFDARGYDILTMASRHYYSNNLKRHNISEEFHEISISDPRTFGAALERARGFL